MTISTKGREESFCGIVGEAHLAFRTKETLIMKKIRLTSSVAGLALAVLTLPSTGAAQGASDEHSKIRAGYALIQQLGIEVKQKGKNPSLVGLGSYIVNAQADCNGCHGNPTYAPGGDPHLGQPEVIDVNGYLIGGNPLFGPFSCRAISHRMGRVVPPG